MSEQLNRYNESKSKPERRHMFENIRGLRTFQDILGVELSKYATAFPEPLLFPDGQTRSLISNLDIFKMYLGENYAQILASQNMNEDYPEQVIGLKERQWTHVIGTPANHDEENSVDLGIKAVKKLMAKHDLGSDDFDFLLFSSTTPHKTTTASSCAIGDALDLKIPSMDMKAGCSSGAYALMTASLYVKAGFGRVLLVAAETPSKYANPKVQETIMGIGDGAVAFLLEPTDKPTGLLGGTLASDGELGKLVSTPGLLPPSQAALDAGLYHYHGNASELKEAVFPRYLQAMKGAFEQTGLTPEDIALYLPHQVNRALTQKVGETLGFAPDRQFHNLHRHGSVAGAALLIALAEALDERIQSGDKVALNVVGGGLTWGGLVWQF